MHTVQSIINDLKSGNISPIYFLMGEEPYFIDQISNFFESSLLPESSRGFDQTVVYGKDINIDTLISNAKRFPMISDRQLIIVKEAQNLSRSIDQLLEYSKQPQKSTTIVFCYKYKSLDKRKALYKSLSKTNIVFESKKVYESNIPSWISNQLKIKGYNITPKSSHLLCEYLGNDLTKIINELDKLILVVGEDKMITDQTIESNIGISKDFNNFELQNAIASNNYSKAFQIVQYFSKNPKKHSIILTISTLYSFFVKIMKLHTIATNDPKIVASSIGVNPYFLKDYLKAKDFFSMRKISSVFETLREIDMKSKGVDSNLNSKELYNELLIRIFNN